MFHEDSKPGIVQFCALKDFGIQCAEFFQIHRSVPAAALRVMTQDNRHFPLMLKQNPGNYKPVAAVVSGTGKDQRRFSAAQGHDEVRNAAANALHQFKPGHSGLNQPAVKGTDFFG